MRSVSIITWIVLLFLTIVSAMFSSVQEKYIIPIIMTLAAFKFIGVAFQFMELKRAHFFWKSFIFIYLVIVITLILAIK